MASVTVITPIVLLWGFTSQSSSFLDHLIATTGLHSWNPSEATCWDRIIQLAINFAMKIKSDNVYQILDTKEALDPLGAMESTRSLVKSSGFGNPGPVTHHCTRMTLSKLHILSKPLFSHLKKGINNTHCTNCKSSLKWSIAWKTHSHSSWISV